MPRLPRSRAAVAVLVIVVAGIALRVAASTTELWQDEIWSILLVHALRSPLEIVTTIHADNNNPINSWFLYALGTRDHWLSYRLLSVTTGTAAVLVAGALARRRGRMEAVTTVLLFATSFLMVLYSSEARGYMPSVLFALLAFRACDEFGRRAGARIAPVLFGACVVLGFLSHLTFAFAYLALVQWMLARVSKRRGAASYGELLRWNALPLATLLLWFVVDIRHQSYGGVYERIPLLRSLGESVTWPLGLPTTAVGMAVGALVSLAVIAAGLRGLRRAHADEWSFYLSMLTVPIAVLIGVGLTVQTWFPRYLLIWTAFFYLLLAAVLCRQYRSGRRGKLVYCAVLLVFVLGNGWRVMRLYEVGRGRYLEALTYIADSTPGGTVHVASSHDPSVALTLWFYASRIEGKRLAYDVASDAAAAPPPWFIVTSQTHEYVPDGELAMFGSVYELARAYDCYESCYRWFVYRKSSPSAQG